MPVAHTTRRRRRRYHQHTIPIPSPIENDGDPSKVSPAAHGPRGSPYRDPRRPTLPPTPSRGTPFLPCLLLQHLPNVKRVAISSCSLALRIHPPEILGVEHTRLVCKPFPVHLCEESERLLASVETVDDGAPTAANKLYTRQPSSPRSHLETPCPCPCSCSSSFFPHPPRRRRRRRPQ